MPPGAVTVPLPAPAGETVNVKSGVKVAVTFFAAFIVTMQAPVPVQAPLQPVNAEPAAGVGVSVTSVPGGKPAMQVAPQLMPPGLDEIVPEPAPAGATVRANGGGAEIGRPVGRPARGPLAGGGGARAGPG